MHSRLSSELLFGSTWRILGSHELWWWKTVPWKLNLERLCCARLARTWCCDIRSKQNGNICQKQTQHPGGTHSTRLYFETRRQCLSADGPFYVCIPPLATTHFPIWSWTPGCHVRAVAVCSLQGTDATLFQHMLIHVCGLHGSKVRPCMSTQFDGNCCDSCLLLSGIVRLFILDGGEACYWDALSRVILPPVDKNLKQHYKLMFDAFKNFKVGSSAKNESSVITSLNQTWMGFFFCWSQKIKHFEEFHCVSSAKVVGSIPREHTYWEYKCIAWMH